VARSARSAVAGTRPDKDRERRGPVHRRADALRDEDRLPVRVMCQAVRAPGVKCTLAAAKVEVASGAATASMYTSPVNQSAGPFWVSRLERVICITASPGP
jgi:hypothetical protein